ncbi:Bcr/CflA family efflux MFS transporter [Hoeflea prorocentri]|uniref:Bcr/CflA family efflux transporter n=1 Tax=Hoeflea prorocentri TaxID=1922333 RepID=A0A9X3UMV1_9HYPH|nr:Bcr/CflA family efflux MFS transporter [Hoeflea prorocentri]MCY6383618.1 Bcr/CflA family efflux MFS transporter [Hoeflea prorocentri]MDA5401418.1 Bcr/CflA family efflux MFS transporter [Hoeflea prorocentri]
MMGRRAIVVFCGLLMSVTAFSVDITLPAFPQMMNEFSTGFTQVQWSVTAFLFATGIGQLVWGSFSDRFGRRPTLFIGLTTLLAGQMLAIAAPTIDALLVARVIQGLGAAAAIVSCRAILRDLFSGQELARSMAFASAVFAIGPMLAPLFGALITEFSGWRFIFVALGILATLLLILLAYFEETSPQKDRRALHATRIKSNVAAVFHHPQSRFFMIVSMFVMAFMLLILTGAAPVYETEFGITGVTFAVLFGIHGLGIVAGQILNRRLIVSIGVFAAIAVAGAVMVAMSGLLLFLSATGLLTVYVLPVILALANAAFLVFYSNATSLVLDPHHERAGFAVSLFGFFTQMGGAGIVSILVYFSNDSAVGMSSLMFVIAIGTCAALILWKGRSQEVGET